MVLAVTEDELQKLLSKTSFISLFGFKLYEIGEGTCTLHIPFQKLFERPDGIISGPTFMAAADVAMWLAIMTRLGILDKLVTVEMKTAFLSAAKGEDFFCMAKILKMGRRLVYGTAECANRTNKLLTHHTLTYIRPDDS
jgi:acyl-coenzyme A thioesterase PaaI-like protein